MNPVFDATDGPAIPLILTVTDSPNSHPGNERELETRGVVAFVRETNTLKPSGYNGWVGTPSLAAGERVAELTAILPDLTEKRFVVLYGARHRAVGGLVDTTRFQLAVP